MKKYIINMIVLLFSSGLFAQGIYNNGAKIAVGVGTYLTIGGTNGNYRNETNVTNGSVDLTGTLTLTGNLTNNVTGSDVFGTVVPGSVVVLKGTTPQTLGGTTTFPVTFPNLTVNNSAGILAAINIQVNGTMALTSGLVNLGNNNLVLGPIATIGGTPSSSNMIVATGTGQVQKLLTGVGSFIFPIGDNNVTAKYSPVTLNFTSGTFVAGAYAAVNVINTAYSDPYINTSYLNRYWNVSQSGITGFNANATFTYLAGDVVGTESQISATRINPTPIVAFNPADVILHQLTANALSSLGTFTGAIDQNAKTLNLTSIMLEGLYNGGGTMRQAQDANGAHWPAGVADHITVELHSATLYSTLVYSITDVPLSTTGTATLTIPSLYNGSYYITVKHRNSLETTSATAVSFVGGTINQSYGALANVFGGNLGISTDSHYLIYGGDVNQDGIVDTSDMNSVDNGSTAILIGYNAADVNGDGIVDTSDMNIVDNNSTAIRFTQTP